jgi:raffinose/stachyose/melibiose transport system permease protein
MHTFCKRWIKLLFLLPTLVFFSTYTLFPIFSMVRTTFQYNRLGTPPRFQGLQNYALLFQDEVLPTAIRNTFIVTGGELLLIIPFAFLLGLLLNKDFRGNGLIKLISFTPYMLSGVITTLVWFFVIDPRIGVLNNFLKQIGLGTLAKLWIGGKALTPYTVAFLDSWKTLGFYAVLFLAGLKMIPRELYEAATIDGASPTQQSVNLTIPLLKETFKICVVYVIINGFQTFQTVVVLVTPRGNPNYLASVIATYIYDTEWGIPRNMGYGSTLALIMFVAIMGLSIGFLTLTRRRVEV